MQLLDHEVKALRALVSRELVLLGHLDTKSMGLDRLLQHYRIVMIMGHLEQKLRLSYERRTQVRAAAAAATDDHQPT